MYDQILEFVENFDETNIDEKFKKYLTKVRPMTGAGVVQLLNGCVARIDKDKCYFEVGTHRGSTLLGAALNNTTMCYGLDNFTGHIRGNAPFKNIEEGLQDAIERLSSGNVKYFKDDFHNFLKREVNIEGKKIEVYFYDADHGRSNQYLGIKLALPLLSKRAIILVDDSGQQDKGAVWDGIKDNLKEDSRLSVVREFTDKKKMNVDGMWQGVVVLKFEDE